MLQIRNIQSAITHVQIHETISKWNFYKIESGSYLRYEEITGIEIDARGYRKKIGRRGFYIVLGW